MKTETFIHHCPKCGTPLEYKREANYNKATKEGRLCSPCSMHYNQKLWEEYVMEIADNKTKLPKFVKEYFKENALNTNKELKSAKTDKLSFIDHVRQVQNRLQTTNNRFNVENNQQKEMTL